MAQPRLNGDEHKIQLFLQRAAPVVLQDATLNAERWQQLALIAGELDLSSEQFRSTLDDLLSRGVLQRIDVHFAKPPPLPGRAPAADPPPSDSTLTDLLSNGDAPPQLAAAAQPVPPPVQQLPMTSGAPESSQSTPPENHRSIAESQGNPGSHSSSNRGQRQTRITRAGAGPANHGTPSGQPRAVSNEVRSESERATPDVPNPPPERGVTRWRVEGEPVPIPPPPPKKPRETYVDFLRQSFARADCGVIGEQLEERLLLHGTRLLGLSRVFARHLLLTTAAETGLIVTSSTAGKSKATEQSAGEPQVDFRYRAFAEAALPILAQYRGFNVQSRVLLNAIAREQGLSEPEMESAVATLGPALAANEADEAQQERLAPFRDYADSVLKRLPNNILPPILLDKLLSTGIDLHGVTPELVHETIRTLASDSNIAIVTQEQAEQYLGNLVAELLGDDVWLRIEQRERIQQAASQWGLPATVVDQFIQQRSQANRTARHQEQRVTRWALGSASLAVILVVGFVVFLIFHERSGPAIVQPAQSEPTVARPPSPAIGPQLDDAWWGIQLAFAVEQARTVFPNLHGALRDLAAKDATRRQTAYSQLIAHLSRGSGGERNRLLLLQVLSQCMARDPEHACASHVAAELVRVIPKPDDTLPSDPEELSAVIGRAQAVTSAIQDKAIAPDRLAQLTQILGRSLGFVLDSTLPPNEIEKTFFSALGDRLFRMLISVASKQAPQAAQLHAALTAELTAYLDRPAIEKLNAEFLVAALTAAPDSWRQLEDLLRITIRSSEPLAILQLVDLYESTPHRELQRLLEELLLARTGISTERLSVEQLAERVRRELGIDVTQDPRRPWLNLSRDAQRAVDAAVSAPERTDAILAEIATLAHFATLACAFAEDEFGSATIAELRKAGPLLPAMLAESRSSATADASPVEIGTSPNPEALAAIREHVIGLSIRRTPPDVRVNRVAMIGRLADAVPDVPPELAIPLASYLLGNKSTTEHDRLMEHVPSLAKWNQLLLAVADRLQDSLLSEEQLSSLVTRLLGRDVVLPEGKAGLTAATYELWQTVLRRLTSEGVSGGRTSSGDAAAQILQQLYERQAQMLGVAIPPADRSVASPSPVLRGLLQEMSTRLSASVSSQQAKNELARTAHELVAIEYVATNDLQRTALLERLWLRILAIEAVRRNEQHSAEATTIIRELESNDRDTRHVLAQLRENQTALLRLWLLIGKST